MDSPGLKYGSGYQLDELSKLSEEELQRLAKIRIGVEVPEQCSRSSLTKLIIENQKRYKNHLSEEKSPYLLQHANNPVNWFAFNDVAFKTSQDEDKPILLSIGYATCHWCHVMEKESFEDDDIAFLLNRNFIAIKIDREELPDVDNIYMKALQATGQNGGWPLNVFVTPTLKPFFAGTYFTKQQFKQVLFQISTKWKQDRPNVDSISDEIAQVLSRFQEIYGKKVSPPLDKELLIKMVKSLHSSYDSRSGGFGSAPKFPPCIQLRALLRVYRRTQDNTTLDMIETTLHCMAHGGLYDHIGGGFSRYSTDASWTIPHFEKMLYDNALLGIVYTEAYQVTQNDLYMRVAKETLNYVLRVLTHPEGGFYSAEDADSEGVEGKFYVWTKSELESILTKEEFNEIRSLYFVSERGNFEDNTNHLCMNKSRKWEEKDSEISKSAHKKLFDTREKRVHPLKDDKILTCWNGLMIHAMSLAARVFDNSTYLEAAQKAASFIKDKLWRDGKLLRRYRDNESHYEGTLDDYTFLIHGLIQLFLSDFDTNWISWAQDLQSIQDELFWDEKDFGYFYTQSNSNIQLIVRSKEYIDESRPNSNSVSALNLMMLHFLTTKSSYHERAEEVMQASGELILRAPEAFAQMLIALDFKTENVKQIVISSDSSFEETKKEVLPFLSKVFAPTTLIVLSKETQNHIELTSNKKELNGKATYYICEGAKCKEPTNDVAEVLKELTSSSKLP